MSIVIINGPSGVQVGKAIRKIRDSIGAERVEVCNLDEEFVDEVVRLFPGTHRPSRPLKSILWELPRDLVSRVLWPRAAVKALNRLINSQAAIKILTCHLTYYRGQTREFYEPADFIALTEADGEAGRPEIACVITLIDDVFDVFASLTAEEEIFDIRAAIIEEHRRRLLEGNSPKEAGERYVLAFEQAIGMLFRIFAWRSREVAAGDNLATYVKARHYVLAVKHPVKTAVDLILSETGLTSNRLPVYLSHPISRPRRQQRRDETREWPRFVTEFQNFVAAVEDTEWSEDKALLFMPTAIDEFRISDWQDQEFPCLHRRWPLPAGPLLYDLPDSFENYDDYERNVLFEALFNPVGSGEVTLKDETGTRFAQTALEVGAKLDEVSREKVRALLDSLIQQLRLQLAQRDHALVRQCGRLLLYRPLFEEHRLSAGVRAEITNWHKILDATKSLYSAGEEESIVWKFGRAVYVHDTTDVEPLGKAIDESLRMNLSAAIASELGTEGLGRLNFATVDLTSPNWINEAREIGGDLLGGESNPAWWASNRERIEEIWRRERDYARRAVLIGDRLQNWDWAEVIEVPHLSERSYAEIRALSSTRILPKLLGSIDLSA